MSDEKFRRDRGIFRQRGSRNSASWFDPRLSGSYYAFFNIAEDVYHVLLPFIRDGLECGEKAVHTVDPRRR